MTTTSMPEALRELNRRRRFRRMRRVVLAVADATRDLPGFRSYAALVTLTYADGSTWSSRDVARYLNTVRGWLRRRGVPCRYQWVIELTRKGYPHYHILFWLPEGVKLPKPDSSGQWGRGLSRIERARRPVGYLVKYATKGTDGDLPKGARLFGCGAGEDSVRHVRHRAGLPAWLDAVATAGEVMQRVVGLGWVERGTGAVHGSPYSVFFLRDADDRVVFCVVQHSEVMQ